MQSRPRFSRAPAITSFQDLINSSLFAAGVVQSARIERHWSMGVAYNTLHNLGDALLMPLSISHPTCKIHCVLKKVSARRCTVQAALVHDCSSSCPPLAASLSRHFTWHCCQWQRHAQHDKRQAVFSRRNTLCLKCPSTSSACSRRELQSHAHRWQLPQPSDQNASARPLGWHPPAAAGSLQYFLCPEQSYADLALCYYASVHLSVLHFIHFW